MNSSPPPFSSPAAAAAGTSSTTRRLSPASAGTKRPASSLLPAFEPLSSSPGLPRPAKRQATERAHLKYPTPVPTSSTGILASSPPLERPHLSRTASGRAPLSDVRDVVLPENGKMITLGRSSTSSQIQLSEDRLVSRVHIKARYIPATAPLEANKIEIVCTGWNGLTLHCTGRRWDLFKGDTFSSETEGTDLIVDVVDARVMIKWPRRGGSAENLANLSDSSWDDSPPRSQLRGNSLLQSSPLRRHTRITSPESPTPAGNLSSSQRLQALIPEIADHDDSIQIYEDEPELPEPLCQPADVGVSMRTDATASFSSDLSDVEDDNDPNEENDPVVHSFGPFGGNISSRLAAISTQSTQQPQEPHRRTPNVTFNKTFTPTEGTPSMSASPLIKKEYGIPSSLAGESTTSSSKEHTSAPPVEIDPAIANHVVNQLAFSRLSSTPLDTIMQNLPAEHRSGLTNDVLRFTLESTLCIGVIPREGKDAAGKPLQTEYYYEPDKDSNLQRRDAVAAMKKPSLRNCRKQHKVGNALLVWPFIDSFDAHTHAAILLEAP
ncbi:target of SBF [Conoideocrella luteorostrata]|uniref:Target of SBF n=1 Tax=Conoideocrella luteorostrata TaxID=1105319 RepID=A0AAJ0FYR9_9HYPO|nr:target of SBF [Conoideocrella luteorostrata]